MIIILSSFFLIINTGEYVYDIEISWANYILSNHNLAIIFTLIGYTATLNSWNFIDGLNGLASGLSIIVLSIILIFCKDINLNNIDNFIIINIFAILGFYLFNIFTGKIFLGDIGSYYLGILIAWLGVKTYFNSDISAWIIFVLILYPATELIFSFFRRIFYKKSPFEPDNLHLHSLLFNFLQSKILN